MSKLTQQDRKDLEKFTKFLIYKSLQIIVQSRLGEKIQTKSKPFSSGADWFNLAIKDVQEVHAETKKALAGQTALLSQNVCVEISLKTSEGDSMILETWYIGLNKDTCDVNARVSYTVYNRMGSALKTLLSISRVTPAYKLSRQQGVCSDDYVICYRFYQGEPQFFMLGDNYQTIKVGTVPTPVGTIYMNLAYRTKLLITPQKSSREILFEVKDDHFKKDNSPRRPTTPKPCSLGYRRNSTSEDLFGEGYDGQDLCSTTFDNSPAEAFFHGMLHNPQQLSAPQQKTVSRTLADDWEGKEQYRNKQETVEKQLSFTSYQRIGAFAQNRNSKEIKNDFEDVPFLSLLQPESKPSETKTEISGDQNHLGSNDKVSKEKLSGEKAIDQALSPSESVSSNTSAPDDFVMVELKTPFAGADPNTDLGTFYRECQGAPQLAMCSGESNVTEALEEISCQLQMFESNIEGFDDFVTSITESVTVE
ncbi:autophagy-related protein 13-like [Saccostrea echinata]|uniref:autophagy-related protein 13-like n=1 Tax=Saccostrea echinata TaxID=191078 RepID=UPI002A80D0E5|nr:autophagy-related protein 13-like [Saccostrea echinata]